MRKLPVDVNSLGMKNFPEIAVSPVSKINGNQKSVLVYANNSTTIINDTSKNLAT